MAQIDDVEAADELLQEGLRLGREGRHEDEIALYDEVIVRFGDAVEPELQLTVAWALHDKMITLRDLERPEEALAVVDEFLARFAAASVNEIRCLVSWGLWNKSVFLAPLGRNDEISQIYGELVARHDEELDDDLCEIVAWCLDTKAGELAASGATEEQLGVYADIVGRFADSTDRSVRLYVLNAVTMKAYELSRLGRREDELAAYDELVALFHEAPEADMRRPLAEGLRRKAVVLDRLGRAAEALEAYDDALALLAGDTEPQAREQTVDVLTSKGRTLRGLKRDAEAVVVFESAVSVYAELASDGGATAGALDAAVSALLNMVAALCALDRGDETERVRNRLVALLGDVTEPSDTPAKARATAPSDADLAELLADVLSGDYWDLLATSGNDEPSRALMADRALVLYRQTARWSEANAEAWETPAFGAVTVLRQVADGYAMLSRWLSTSDRAALPLPNRLLAEWLIQLLGINEWAAEHGHSFDLRESPEAIEELVEANRAATEEPDPGLAQAFAAAIRSYELLAVLCDSPSGREALHRDTFKSNTCWQIANARTWHARAWQHVEEAAGAAAVMALIAEAFFVAAHDDVTSSVELFPSRDMLRNLLRVTDAYGWLTDQDVELPDWLAEDD